MCISSMLVSWLPQSELTIFAKRGDEVLVRVVHYADYIFVVNLGRIEV